MKRLSIPEAGMSETFTEITDAELDALIARVQEAIEHNLALSVADLQLLLNALMTLAHLHERQGNRSMRS